MSKKIVYWVVADVSSKNAGYRLRIEPLAKALKNYSISPVIISTDELVNYVKKIVVDAIAVIVSKPSDTETLLCIKYLLAHDVRVLADYFDNYLSWSPSLYKRGIPWQWLSVMKIVSGICVSTPFIAETVCKIGLSEVCLVSDPSVERLGGESFLSSNLHTKWHKPDQLELLWFGISNNPYYSVGIDDLISWERVISYISARLSGVLHLRLTICTNRTPNIESAIVGLRSADINIRFVEWTEKNCEELLMDSHLVLLPSNLSGFSLSKTHNRCSDAIDFQCLVLSSPNGPYHDIPGAVYRDIDILCNDLTNLDPTHIANVINQSRSYLSETHAISEQAYNLAKFISKKNKSNSKNNCPILLPLLLPPVLIVGSGSPIKAIKSSRNLGYISASAQDFNLSINFDILLRSVNADDAIVTFEISKNAKHIMEELYSNKLEELDLQELYLQEINGITILKLKLPELEPLLKSIDELRAIFNSHINLRDRFFEYNIAIIIISLRYLGFYDLDFSSNEANEWESYIAYGDPELEMATKKLHQLWKDYQGNEINVGRPKQFESSNRTGVFNV